MKKIIFLLAMAVASSAQATDFLSAFEDVPRMSGLVEEETMSFDTDNVRIAEQYVSSDTATAAELFGFYSGVLGELGWTAGTTTPNSNTYTREGESLNISVMSESPLVAVFSLRPL